MGTTGADVQPLPGRLMLVCLIATGLAVCSGDWKASKVTRYSHSHLIHRCHVHNSAKACAEIQRRTELRP